MLFPGLAGTVCRIDLDEEARAAVDRGRCPLPSDRINPFLNPDRCAALLAEVHQALGASWSYGGWLEDRHFLWRGSYLENTGNFIHLGVDFNVPQGTPVGGAPGRVFLVDDDGDADGGWGGRLFLRPSGPAGAGTVLIYAHLQNVRCQPGDLVEPGQILAETGGPPGNGNWHPHLHVQAIRQPLFEEILRDRFDELDGYGHPDDLPRLARDYPDPLPVLAGAART